MASLMTARVIDLSDEKRTGMPESTKCAVNHGRIVRSDKDTITFEDGVVVRKGTMEVLFDPRSK